MKNLFLFLLIALIATYVLNPSTVSKRLLYAIGIPVCGLLIYCLIIYFFVSPYSAGAEITMSIIPTIISAIIINHQLKKKSENDGKVKFPIILVIFLVLSLIVSIVQYSIESSNKKIINKYMKDKYHLNLNSIQNIENGIQSLTIYECDFNG